MWAKVLMALVTIVLIGLGTIYLLGIVERGRWERYTATLREAGEPLTFEEIEARRAEVPDERNSALVIEAALEEFPPHPTDRDAPVYVFVFGNHRPKVDFPAGIPRYAIDDSRAFLEQHRPLLDALRPVLGMPTGRVTVDFAENPLETTLPNLAGLRTAAKLSRLDAILRLIDGDTGGTLDTAVLQFHIASSLNEYPSVIGHLVAMACDRLGLRTAEDLLRAGEVPEAALIRLGETLAARRGGNPMRWSMWSERASSVESYDLLASGEIPLDQFTWGSGPTIPSPGFLPEFIVRKNQLVAVEMWTRLVDAGDDLTAMRDVALQLNTELPQLSDTYFLVKSLMPSLERILYLQIARDTLLDCALAGIAAERFRLATGHWPTSLDELVPAYLDQVPIDPFAKGQPLKLVATDQGIVIYSVGEDTIDDGGEVVAEENRRDGPDLGFRLLDPEHRRVVITDEPKPEEED